MKTKTEDAFIALFQLDRFQWLKIWNHYWINHVGNDCKIGLSFESNGTAGPGLYPVRMEGQYYARFPVESFVDFCGLDRLRTKGIGWDPSRKYTTLPTIYEYFRSNRDLLKL